MFDSNIVELPTISDEGVDRININKLKICHHNNPPTNVIITVVTVDGRPNGTIINRHRKKTKPKDIRWTNPKPRKTLNEDDIEWI
jgi:hypothetical protein